MLDIASLGFRVDSSQLTGATGHLNKFSAASDRAAAVTNRLKVALAGLGVGLSLNAFVQAADTYRQMSNTLKVLGNDTQQAADKISDLAAMAARTRTPLGATVDLFQRTSIAARELGASQEQVMRFTENVGLALAQQGGSAESAAGALTQLGQALAGGTVRAEEFNSILEGAYPLALAAAQGIDGAAGSVGRLRNMVVEGQVSSQEFFAAILSQSSALEAAFANTAPTVGQAMQVLRDSVTLTVGAFDSATGASSGFASAIMTLAQGVNTLGGLLTAHSELIQRIVPYATAAAVAYGGVLAVSLGSTLVTAIRATITQMIALEMALGATTKASALMSIAIKAQAAALSLLKRALVATGFGALIVGMGEALNLFMRLKDATDSWGGALSALGDLARLVWQGIVDSASAIPAGLSAVWNAVRADFFSMIAGLAEGWQGFVDSLNGAFGNSSGFLFDVSSSIGTVAANMEGLAESAKGDVARNMSEAGGIVRDAFAPVAAKMAELTASTNEASAASTKLGNAGGAGPRGAGGKVAKGAGAAAAATKDLLAELNKELDARQALIGLYGEERERAEALQQVQQKLGDDLKKYSAEAIQGAQDRIVAIGREEKAWEATMQRMDSLTDSLAGAFGDWMADGLRSFKDFTSAILGSFKSMISDMIATAVRNPIQLTITGAMGGMGGAGAAGAGVPGAGGAGILGGIGAAVGGLASWGISGGVAGFTGLMSGGVGGALTAVGTQAALAGSGLSSLAVGLGAIAAPVAAVAGLFSFFEKSTKELDAGLRITVDGMDTLVETFSKTETRRFWGLSKKRKTDYDAADAATADPIEAYVAKMQTGVMDMAKLLGVGAGAFENFSAQIKLSTKDMTDEQAIQAIQAELTKLGDEFAGLVPDLAKFSAEGEGAHATLTRLSASLVGVNASLGDLGLRLYDLSVNGAGAAAAFADMFGGLDQFQQAAGAYYQEFYSEAERMTRLQEVSTKALRDAGLAVPATREAYRALVEAQNLSTDAGRKAAAVLLQLAPAFDQMFDAAEAARLASMQSIADANALRAGLLDSLMTDQQRAVQAQAEITATFAALNMTVPTTLEGLRAIIAGLDLTSEAGRTALAQIAGIADELKDKLIPAQGGGGRVTSSGGGGSRQDNTAEERERLERQLLQLQGNTFELRQRELNALAPANRALQEMIWQLEDAKDAMDNLKTDGFATLVDFELARARQANNKAAPVALKAQETRQRQDSAILTEIRDYMFTVANNTHRAARETRDLRMLQEGTGA